MVIRVISGDCRAILPTLPDASVQCCVTSPPYYGLRDYGVDGQIGLEPTPDEYVAEMVAVFREVRRVLRDDGTLWLNIGDSYNNFRPQMGPGQAVHGRDKLNGKPAPKSRMRGNVGYKEKDLLGIPWLLAFALRADGWYLRSDIIWHKPNPMPESVRDRPTSAHEHVFLLTKSARYYYDTEAAQEEITSDRAPSRKAKATGVGHTVLRGVGTAYNGEGATRNARNVWTIATQPYSGAHFATMPPDLAERCIKAGTKPGDTVLDPFGGAGTTGLVADRLGRHAVLIELNPAYQTLATDRVQDDAPLLFVRQPDAPKPKQTAML